MVSQYVVRQGDIEGVLKLAQGASPSWVRVASEEFYVRDGTSLGTLGAYLVSCLEGRFFPWVVVG